MVRKIKEQLCSVTLDQEKIAESTCLASSANDVYELPDGATVTLGNDRFRAAEGLFHPSIFGTTTDRCSGFTLHSTSIKVYTNCRFGSDPIFLSL